MSRRNTFQNFIAYCEVSGLKWKKSSIYIHSFLSFLATIGFFINIFKAPNFKSIAINLLVLPFVFLALYQGAIMRRVLKERK